jgi:hypothetical protein
MKKVDIDKRLKIGLKRERKRLRRLKIRKPHIKHFALKKRLHDFLIQHDKKVLKHTSFELCEFLCAKNFHEPKFKNSYIEIPEKFSLQFNYDKSLSTIKKVVSNLKELEENTLTLDFSKCKQADFTALFLLNVIISEHFEFYKKLSFKLKILDIMPKLKVINSKNNEVNIQLLLSRFIKEAQGEGTSHIPISSTGLLKGNRTRKHYLENIKGIVATQIVEYVNHCLIQHGYEINPSGKNDLGGIISEVLNNAEDHSPFNTWYAFASFLQVNKPGSNLVGELNLSFLNFGYTVFQGFEDTKDQNSTVYLEMEKLYAEIQKKYRSNPFTKENLFTLYALQDGFSRIKFESVSRGTGTMKFLNSFMNIGDYEDTALGFSPCLSITSGHTKIISDTKYKPFQKNKLYFISLNKENDLTTIPDKTHLEQKTDFFPGTILSVRIYINKEHLRKKVDRK